MLGLGVGTSTRSLLGALSLRLRRRETVGVVGAGRLSLAQSEACRLWRRPRAMDKAGVQVLTSMVQLRGEPTSIYHRFVLSHQKVPVFHIEQVNQSNKLRVQYNVPEENIQCTSTMYQQRIIDEYMYRACCVLFERCDFLGDRLNSGLLCRFSCWCFARGSV